MTFQGDRGTWLPEGTLVGGAAVESVAARTRRASGPLVQLATGKGQITLAPEQEVRVRRRSVSVGGPYGDPQWLPAGRVRLGDWLSQPGSGGRERWLAVTAVTQRDCTGLLYRFDTADDAVLAHGFLVKTDGPQQQQRP